MGMFDDHLDEGMAATKKVMRERNVSYEEARKIVVEGEALPVQHNWVSRLTLMQQSVLFSAIRNADGMPKFHKAKDLTRFYRRCILLSAFDKRELNDPFEKGGGSFTGPIKTETLDEAAHNFIDSRDEMTLHYYAHAAHAFEIVGYKHPNPEIRKFWNSVYNRMCHALHMWPETEEQMDSRLGDTQAGWEARNDPSSVCSD